MQGLRESEHLADREWNGCGIALKIVFCGEAVLFAEVVIDIAVDLGGIKLARRSLDEGIKSLVPTFGVSRIRGWHNELAARSLGVEDGQRDGIHLAGVDARWVAALAASVIGVHQADKSRRIIPICIRQTLKRGDAIERTAQSIADPLALIGPKEKHLIFLNRPPQRRAENVAMERRSTREEWIRRQESWSRIENIVLEVFVNLAVEMVCPGLGCGFDVCAAG